MRMAYNGQSYKDYKDFYSQLLTSINAIISVDPFTLNFHTKRLSIDFLRFIHVQYLPGDCEI